MSNFYRIPNPGTECQCVIVNREDREPQRDWLKRCMCWHHWTQTNYYRDRRRREELTGEKKDG